jgi:hypothetical protein
MAGHPGGGHPTCPDRFKRGGQKRQKEGEEKREKKEKKGKAKGFWSKKGEPLFPQKS